MPFSESSSNLPNHKHDQTVTQDGGALDMSANSTSGSLAPGSITFSDATGAHMEELAIGAATEVLTVAGGVPTWSAAAGGGASCSDSLTIGTQTRSLCEWLEIGV